MVKDDVGLPTAQEISEFRSHARNWLQQAEIPLLPAEYDERHRVLREWHRALYEAGWVGLQWPSEYGGHDLTIAHQLAFTEELARAGAPQPVGSIGLEVVGPTLLRYGTQGQRERFVQPLLAAEELWCQGFSEPGAGSDLASLRTRGVIGDDQIIVTGQKVWTSWATYADFCAVLARTDPEAPKHKGISYLLVDMRSPGITVRPIVQLTGDAEFCEVFFDEVSVPRSNVLGELHGGWPLVMNTLGHERAEYAVRRRLENQLSFNQILGALRSHGHQHSDDVAEQIGAVYAHLRGFESLSRQTVKRLLAGNIPSPLDSVDKLHLADTEQHLFGVALDLLGPHRMAPSSRPLGLDAAQVIKSYLYGRAASVYGGTAQIQRSIVGERLLGLPREAR
ncbi:acyl-CoA dehydrogenase family protein [Mycobacterium vicinigordonae]|uniref:Acyl-CoA dehydrogenase family protein n=1 Tax=Mycobacterium vicinigordonae TaxID=1719132 RepID=A0A7D6HZ68_9MYCO|nr:acyl-CoA dehydrogenase family protein [Mycobacterium vicinigordonae]QLL06234.1 acyl-CoA dehydrogenase family protein [Mycobacterium vicinigordonae]